jgi:opacity protein-like surface antigen
MKKKLMVMVCALVLVTAALAAAKFFNVSGAGMAIDADQATADQNADSQAQTNLQNACSAGTLTSQQKIFDQCSQAGDHYVCNVNYSGICKIGN